MERLTPAGFGLRFGAACALVLATFNPSGHSYVHWFAGAFPHISPVQALIGITLAIGWAVYLTATWRSLGPSGVALISAFLGALLWMLVSWGWVNLHRGSALTWVSLLLVSLVLATGISWSLLRRQITGQADVDEVSDP